MVRARIFRKMALVAAALAAAVSFPALATGGTRDMLAVLRFSNTTGDPRFDEFHLLVRKRLEYLMLAPGMPVKAWDATIEQVGELDPADTSGFRFVASGSFRSDSPAVETVMRFSIVNKSDNRTTGKRVVLGSMTMEEAAAIVVAKIGDFLRQNVLGRLSVTSQPAGARISLNGLSGGEAPQEFSLEPGRYVVELRSDFYEPFHTEVDLASARNVDLHASLSFKGYPTVWWFAAAVASTGLTIGAYAIESRYHQDYRDLPAGSPRIDFDRAFNSYRNANALRLILQNITVVPWTGAGFCFFVNRSLKKRMGREGEDVGFRRSAVRNPVED